jgi:serine protease Do
MKRNAVAWAALVVSSAALLSSQNLYHPLRAKPDVPAEGQKTAKALSDAFGAVAEFVKPSVVQVSVQRKMPSRALVPGRRSPNGPRGGVPRDVPKEFEDMLKRFFGPDFSPFGPEPQQFGGRGQGMGSGFVYDDKGHILTNNHVVEGAEKIVVTFHDGTEADAKVVGTDPGTDVAVIKVDQTGFRPALKGNSRDVKVGEWVLAVGSPFQLEQTVTAGIVSATGRAPHINDYEAFIQTDASINPGNSGGPLVDMNGRVIGINSAIMTGNRTLIGLGSNAGIGFAIPMDLASHIADKLIKDGKVNRVRLGVGLSELSPAVAKQLGLDPHTHGILVSYVAKGSPAEKAGLKEGDVITGFNGTTIDNGSVLKNMVATSDAGRSYTLTYLRDGHEQKVQVVPVPEGQVRFEGEDQNEEQPALAHEGAKDKKEVSGFGLTVQPLTPELAAQFGYTKDTEGLVITDVKEGSPADTEGLKEGFVITKFIKDKKLQPAKSVSDFQELAKNADNLSVLVLPGKPPGGIITMSKAK